MASHKVGYVGAGNINKNHMKCAAPAGLEVAAVFDVFKPAADEAAKLYEATAFDDYDAMLRSDIDAVFIGTPNKFHAPQTIAALQAGKHVFLEKPMAMNVGESDAIIAARDKAGKVVQMGMVNRFQGSSQTLKDFVTAGRCGEIYSGQTFWWRRRGIPGFGGWFTTKSMSGGGALIDIGVHMLDLAMYLMGFPEPVAVSGSTYNTWKKYDEYTFNNMWAAPRPGTEIKDKDVDDYATAKIRFSGGQSLSLDVSWALNIPDLQPEMGLRLQGDKGGVALEGMDKPRFYGEQEGHVVDVVPQYKKVDAMQAEDTHFGQVLRGEAELIPTAEQGRTVQRVLDAIYRSSDEGREVRLD